MNETQLFKKSTLPESEFWKGVLIVFVAYSENVKGTACWKGLIECVQVVKSLNWLAFQTGLRVERIDIESMPSQGRIKCYSTNVGLGVCYNLAAEEAKTLGKKWLCFFDSDFAVTAVHLTSYFKGSLENRKAEILIPRVKNGRFILSPYQTFLGRYKTATQAVTSILQPQIWFWINNGMLVDRTLFEKAGGYHSDIIADFSDTLFCYRVRKICPQLMLLPMDIEHRHSAFSLMKKEQALFRFYVYCLGSKISAREMGLRIEHFFWAIMRACLLSFRFKSFNFMPIPFKSETVMLKQIGHA